MKTFRLIAIASLLIFIGVFSAFGQGTARPGGTSGQASGPVPDSKIAFVDTQAFGDEKTGITKYVNAMKSLEREFQPRQTELQNLQNRINALSDEIKKLNSVPNSVVDPKAAQQKQDQGEALARELDFKKKDADAAFQKRYQEVVGPIYEDIGKALDGFAKQRGITMILDASKLAQMGAILTATDGMDVTRAFIAEYNSRGSTASR